LLASVFVPAIAFGQGAPVPQDQAAAGPGGGVEEVVVTAQRREEKLSKVPIAVLAVSAKQIESSGVLSPLDLPAVAPGLVDAPGGSAAAYFTPFIRGVGSSSVANGDDASVSTYIDGVYQADKQATLFDLADIDHIEILKGPQGTLFGRNSTGGAINIITRQPAFSDYKLDAEASYGSYDQTTDKIYVTGPIIPGILAASVAGEYREGGNFAHNAYLNSDFGGVHNTSVDFKLAWNVNDDIEITNSVFYNNDRERPVNGQDVEIPGTVPLGGLLGGQYGVKPYTTYTNSDFLFTLKNVQDIFKVKWSFDAFDVVSTSSYLYNRQLTDLDYDTTTANIFFFHNPTATKDVSQEIQFLSHSDGPLTWVGGLYYMSDLQGLPSPGQTVNLFVPEPGSPQVVAAAQAKALAEGIPPTSSAFPTVIGSRTKSDVAAYAAYAQGTYAVTDEDKITAGFRWTEELRRYSGSQGVNITNGTSFTYNPFFNFSTGKLFQKPSWRFSYDHSFDDDAMVYFSYNRGFKSGVYNTNSQTPHPEPVQPEKIDAFEVGAKTKWFDRTLQIDTSAFYYDYSNIQVEQIVGFQAGGGGGGSTILQNAASAEIYGLDLDMVYVPTADLRLHGSFEVLSAQYTNYNNASGFLIVPTAPGLPPSVGLSVPIDASNTSAIFAPPYSLTIGGSYTYHLPGDSKLTLDTSYAYQGRYKIVVGSGNFYHPFGQLSGSLTWTDPSDTYYVQAWGRNIGNVKSVGGNLDSFAWSQILIPPAFYGVTVGLKLDHPVGEPETQPAAYVPPPAVAPAPAAAARSYMVFFDFDKSDLSPEATKIVDQAARNAGPAKVTQIEVTGHTDTVGSDAYNMRLSRRRAESVAAQLEKDGIPSGEIAIFAKGKRDLLVPTGDGVREPQNRRVQIVYSGGPNS
jgi:iron complex outermembrane receptor protein